jgi:hypothetical protein
MKLAVKHVKINKNKCKFSKLNYKNLPATSTLKFLIKLKKINYKIRIDILVLCLIYRLQILKMNKF